MDSLIGVNGVAKSVSSMLYGGHDNKATTVVTALVGDESGKAQEVFIDEKPVFMYGIQQVVPNAQMPNYIPEQLVDMINFESLAELPVSKQDLQINYVGQGAYILMTPYPVIEIKDALGNILHMNVDPAESSAGYSGMMPPVERVVGRFTYQVYMWSRGQNALGGTILNFRFV